MIIGWLDDSMDMSYPRIAHTNAFSHYDGHLALQGFLILYFSSLVVFMYLLDFLFKLCGIES